MAVRRQQSVLDQVTQQGLARQLAGVEMAPGSKESTRLRLVALLQGVAHVGEVVTELAKPQRQVEHADVEQQSQQEAHL